ncbi:MAG: HAD hydrolase-like protein [bacterium]
MNKFILFDIDGTLIKKISKTSLHSISFSKAIKKVFGVDCNIHTIAPDGKTDQQIVIEVLATKGIDEEEIRGKMKEVMKEMVTIFEENIETEEMTASKGSKELIEELSKNNILTGLLTGNLEPIAMAKMKKVGLDNYFKIGGFGSDDEVRSNLIKIAIKRAENVFDFNYNDNVFVIGDTPLDIRAGKEAKIKTIGVATGKYSIEDLKKENPNFVFNDLLQKQEILDVLLN